MRYTFDQNGAPAGFSLKNAGETAWTEYYFVKNLQGDVLKVYKAADNALVASYDYDPFGNILSATGSLANTNPFRYRGYPYDAETGFYYLQSRYYDPITCRFINADSYASTGQGFVGYNSFVYCLNNPQMLTDAFGNIARSILDATFEVSAAKSKLPPAYYQVEGMINGQATYEWSDDPLGFGTYGKSGCGVIAIYNAMQLLGQSQSLGTIADEFLFCWGSIGFGIGGVGPWNLDNYFRAHNIDYAGSFSCAELTENISEGDIIVLTSMNKKWNPLKGFHTVTVQYTGGEYIVYNEYNTYTTTTSYATLQGAYTGGVLIYGYRIKIGE